MPELRDIRLALTSGFAQAQFGGKELAQLSGNATGDLAKAQRELGRWSPWTACALAGTFDVEMKSSGDVATATAPLDLALAATFTGLQLDGVAGLEDFQQGHTRLEAGAKVIRGEAGVEALNGVRVVARTGQSERELTLDSLLTADVKYVESKQRERGDRRGRDGARGGGAAVHDRAVQRGPAGRPARFSRAIRRADRAGVAVRLGHARPHRLGQLHVARRRRST